MDKDKELNIYVDRRYRKAGYTISRLYLNGKLFCDVLERQDRGLRQDMGEKRIREIKVPGDTAIPCGRYRVTLKERSPRFSRNPRYRWCGGHLPRLVSVPGFSGVLIHAGTSVNSSRGCLIVGLNTRKGKVTSSMKTLKRLYWRMSRAEEIWLTIGIPSAPGTGTGKSGKPP